MRPRPVPVRPSSEPRELLCRGKRAAHRWPRRPAVAAALYVLDARAAAAARRAGEAVELPADALSQDNQARPSWIVPVGRYSALETPQAIHARHDTTAIAVDTLRCHSIVTGSKTGCVHAWGLEQGSINAGLG